MASQRTIIIDGYNVLFTGLRGQVKDVEVAREGFIAQLAKLASIGNIQYVVIFDAGRKRPSAPPRDKTLRNLDVIYAVNSRNADEAIKEYVEEHSVPESITVVSSDREVEIAARLMGSRRMKAGVFWDSLQQKLVAGFTDESKNQSDHPDRHRALTPDEVDQWLDYFNGDPEEIDEE